MGGGGLESWPPDPWVRWHETSKEVRWIGAVNSWGTTAGKRVRKRSLSVVGAGRKLWGPARNCVTWRGGTHRVIILLERACLHNRIGRNWCKFSRPECATSLETRRSLANDPSGGGTEGEFPGNCSVSYLSFVYGRSLTAGKILFTGKQTCSLYLENDSVMAPHIPGARSGVCAGQLERWATVWAFNQNILNI